MLFFLKQIFVLAVCLCFWIPLAVYFVQFLAPVTLFIFLLYTVEEFVFVKLFNAYSGLAAEDWYWQTDNATNRGIINSVLVLQGAPDVARLRETFQERLLDDDSADSDTYTKARMFVKKGILNQYWVPEKEFKLEDHVWQWSKKVAESKRELQMILEELMIRPFPPERALWECIVVPYCVENVNQTVLLYRVHHSMADGVSLAYFLCNKLPQNPPPTPQTLRKFTQTNRVALMAKGIFLIPWHAGKMMLRQTDSTILHVPDVTGKKIFKWSDEIELGLIKDIKSKLKLTINDILMGCFSKGLHDYFKAKGAPNQNDLLAFLPVDTRANVERARHFGNKFSMIYFSLPVGYDDPVETVLETKRRIDKFKTSGEPFASRWTMRTAAYFLPKLLSGVSFWSFAKKASIVVSNVPGPQTEIVIGGQVLNYMTFWPPARYNIGSSASFFSYNGKVHFGFCADEAVNVDPEVIIDAFNKAVKDLANQLDIRTDNNNDF